MKDQILHLCAYRQIAAFTWIKPFCNAMFVAETDGNGIDLRCVFVGAVSHELTTFGRVTIDIDTLNIESILSTEASISSFNRFAPEMYKKVPAITEYEKLLGL